MNSERRHDLQENELATALGKINESIDPYSKPIGIAVAVGLIGFLGWGFYNSSQSDRRSDATLQLIEASVSGDSETLATVAAQYADTPAAAWSRLYQGSSKMGVGMNALFNSRDEAEELLSEASAAFKEALSLSKDTLIQSRAYFGLARIAESLGDTDEAIKNYEAAMTVGESEAMVEEAQKRIDTLSKPNAKEFLAWFNEQDFAPADPASPPSLPGAGTLPDLPDLDFSSDEDETAADESTDAEGTEPESADEEAATKAEPEMAAEEAAPSSEEPAVKPESVETETSGAEEGDEEPVGSLPAETTEPSGS
ncbi:tetratricopeptide repeat protein [Neorhodopirellula lusitana]|uniref:tetratricopeptide repeat protein n=1 Tax=Neorhodopirellula lusitana TaxID=445327 RepID=UPI00384F62AC